jgi:hypothetical protein
MISGYAMGLHPLWATVAWLFARGSDGSPVVLRTEDGEHWLDVTPGGVGQTTMASFAAIDERTAVYGAASDAFWVTRDGGLTWAEQTLPG